MQSKKKFLFFPIFSLIILSSIYFFYVSKKETNPYQTINGKVVTKDNLFSFIPKAPPEIKDRVTRWFAKNNAYTILVKQQALLTEVGTIDRDCREFFQNVQVKNIGGMNYIFLLPEYIYGTSVLQDLDNSHSSFDSSCDFGVGDENSHTYIVKVSGPSNRFYNTAAQEGWNVRIAYFRRFFSPGNRFYCKYMSFDEDKLRIKKYFYESCPKKILYSYPNKIALKELAYQVCGALAVENLIGRAEYAVTKKFLNNKNYRPKTLKQAFEDFITYIFIFLDDQCYKKEDIAGKKFAKTYNTASRAFHMARFNEVITKLNLYRLQKPPMGYLINLNPQKPYSCEDTDVVFVQKFLKYFKPVDFYIKNRPDIISKIFTKETLFQLCNAIEYSGLWDINGDNIFINTIDNKIIYMDFEHNRSIGLRDIFNGNMRQLKDNLCEALWGLLKLFNNFKAQKKIVYTYMQENNIDLHAYIEKQIAFYPKITKKYSRLSQLGYALCYDNMQCAMCKKLRYTVAKRLLDASNKA